MVEWGRLSWRDGTLSSSILHDLMPYTVPLMCALADDLGVDMSADEWSEESDEDDDHVSPASWLSCFAHGASSNVACTAGP